MASPIVRSNSTREFGEDVDLDNLYPALVECFGIIFAGFLAGKFSLISDVEAKGLATFVGTFSLPALVFSSLCRLDMSSVQWGFLLGIFLAKALLFLLVIVTSLLVIKPVAPEKSGLYAIFTTQSNDFALGYPILEAIYGNSHPECPMYLYLLAPISLLILNPIGFIFMEIGGLRNQTRRNRSSEEAVSHLSVIYRVTKNILSDPIMIMTIAGVLGNFVFKSGLPFILDKLLTTLGSAFSASALFLLGLRIVSGSGAGGRRKPKIGFVTPFILILLKTTALPILAREIVDFLGAGGALNDTAHMSDFAFIYGTIPTAPTVFVFANKYNVEPEMTATAMVACTFIAAPIMFVSAKLLSITDLNPADYIGELDTFLLDVSIIGVLGAVWVTFVLVITKKQDRLPHFMTLSLTVSQAVACIGAILWSVINCTHGWKLYVQFAVYSYGVYATRINTGLLAICVFLVQTQPAPLVHRLKKPLVAFGMVAPAVIVVSLAATVSQETPAHGQKVDPNFQYGDTQAMVALVVLVISFVLTLTMMIWTQRRLGSARSGTFSNPASPERVAVPSRSRTSSSENLLGEEEVEESGQVVNDRSPRLRLDSEQRQYSSSLLDRYNDTADEHELRMSQDPAQIMRHLILLLILSSSMFIGIGLCAWTLVMDNRSGLYLELVFLDGFLNFGQSLFTLALFGVNTDYVIMPVRRFLRRMYYGVDALVLPNWEDLEPETKQHCQLFLRHHLSACIGDIVRPEVRTTGSDVLHREAFRGSALVDWLCEVDLARNRHAAVRYARHLVKGRVLRHVDNHMDFYDDDAFVYTFAPPPESQRP